MQRLFRQASFLFWQYPVLWLPVIAADSLAFGINVFANELRHRIIFYLTTKHSVIGSIPEPIPFTPLQTLKVVVLTKPVDWTAHFITACLYVSAMVTVFTLISNLREKQRVEWASVSQALLHAVRKIALFSLKLLIAIGIGAIPFVLITALFFSANGERVVSTQAFGYVSAVILFCAVAYVLSPSAVTFLKSGSPDNAQPEKIRHARISGALAAISSTSLYALGTQLQHSIPARSASAGSVFYEMLTSLVSAIPYILLFIVLSLIANDEPATELFAAVPELS